MRTRIRNIGNSKGLIIPKSFLNQCKIQDEIIVLVEEQTIVIRPAEPEKRKGWDKAFREMAANGDDELIIPSVFEDENLDDWTWK